MVLPLSLTSHGDRRRAKPIMFVGEGDQIEHSRIFMAGSPEMSRSGLSLERESCLSVWDKRMIDALRPQDLLEILSLLSPINTRAARYKKALTKRTESADIT